MLILVLLILVLLILVLLILVLLILVLLILVLLILVLLILVLLILVLLILVLLILVLLILVLLILVLLILVLLILVLLILVLLILVLLILVLLVLVLLVLVLLVLVLLILLLLLLLFFLFFFQLLFQFFQLLAVFIQLLVVAEHFLLVGGGSFMGAVGGKGVVEAFDGFLDVLFGFRYFSQPGVDFLDLVVDGGSLGRGLFFLRPGEGHGRFGLGGFHVAEVEVGVRLKTSVGRQERLGECFRRFLGIAGLLLQAAFGEFQGLARFFRQVRQGDHAVYGLDGFFRLARADQVSDVVQHGGVRPGFRAHQTGAEQGRSGQKRHAAA